MDNLNKYFGQFLGHIVEVKMDRPMNSKHPRYDFVYDVNYGFIPDTKAPDGEELDAYVLGIDKPLKNFRGKCIAIIHRLDDDDDKLVVVPDNFEDITDEEIINLVFFQEQWFKSVIVRP
jgi:inorganic pyrophosphatase